MDDPSDRDIHMALYREYLEDLGRLGGRHENVRKFYVSLISALFVFLSLAAPNGPFPALAFEIRLLGSLVGVLICASWIGHTQAFSSLFVAKLEVLRRAELEAALPLQFFQWEHQVIEEHGGRIRVTTVDKVVGGVFLVLFLALLGFG